MMDTLASVDDEEGGSLLLAEAVIDDGSGVEVVS